MIDHRLAGLRDRSVRDLGVSDLEQFYAALRARGGRGGRPLSSTSVARVHGVVRLALEQAVRWSWRSDNPAELARPLRHRRTRLSPPTSAEVIRLLEGAAERDPELLTYLFLDAETGARRGELAALRLNDFTGDTVVIARSLAVGPLTEDNLRRYAGHIWPASSQRGTHPTALIEQGNPKNDNSIRTLSISPATFQLVAAQVGRVESAAREAGGIYPENGFLFPAQVDGMRPLRMDTWTHRFVRLRGELVLGSFRLHDLRHFVATTLLTSGVDVSTVAGRLGHGSGGKTTLAIYSHFLRAPDQVASEMMASLLTSSGAGGRSDGPAVVPIRPRTSRERPSMRRPPA
jgi:integrase